MLKNGGWLDFQVIWWFRCFITWWSKHHVGRSMYIHSYFGGLETLVPSILHHIASPKSSDHHWSHMNSFTVAVWFHHHHHHHHQRFFRSSMSSLKTLALQITGRQKFQKKKKGGRMWSLNSKGRGLSWGTLRIPAGKIGERKIRGITWDSRQISSTDRLTPQFR